MALPMVLLNDIYKYASCGKEVVVSPRFISFWCFSLVSFLVAYRVTFSIYSHRYLTLLAHAPIPETGSRSPEHGGSDGLSGTHHACVVNVLVVACVAHLLIR